MQNSVSVITNDLGYALKAISQLAAEIASVSEQLNMYIMTDVIFGFVEAGIGAVSGVISAGSKGMFKFGGKTGMKAIEGGERGTVAIGEDFSRVSIETELSVDRIAPRTSESAVRVEGNISASEASFSSLSTSGEISCSGTIRGNRFQSTASEASSIEMSAEGISFSGNCTFESEVSGNSALFDSFSSSEIRCRPSSAESSELSILRDEGSNAYSISRSEGGSNGTSILFHDDSADLSIRSAAEGWSEEAFRVGRRTEKKLSE